MFRLQACRVGNDVAMILQMIWMIRNDKKSNKLGSYNGSSIQQRWLEHTCVYLWAEEIDYNWRIQFNSISRRYTLAQINYAYLKTFCFRTFQKIKQTWREVLLFTFCLFTFWSTTWFMSTCGDVKHFDKHVWWMTSI